jgi:hypothetical protein
MITIKKIAETLEAARASALPGREASAVNDVLSSVARRLRGDRRQRWSSEPEYRRRHRRRAAALTPPPLKILE